MPPENKETGSFTPSEQQEKKEAKPEISTEAAKKRDEVVDAKKTLGMKFDQEYLESLFKDLQQQFEKFLKWLDEFLGKKKADEKPVEVPKATEADTKAKEEDTKAQEELVKKTDSLDEALNTLRESAKKEQEASLKKIEAKGSIKEGESVEAIYWSEERQEKMRITVSIEDGDLIFVLKGETGVIGYELDVWGDITEVNLLGLASKRSFSLQHNIKGKVPAQTDRLLSFIGTLVAKQSEKIPFTTSSGEQYDVDRLYNTLPPAKTFAERHQAKKS